METIQIETGQNIRIEHKLAGVGSRVVATLIDYFILGLFWLLVLGVFGWLDAGYEFLFVVNLIITLMVLLYQPLCELLLDGASIGKKIMRIKIVKLNGDKLGVTAVSLRALLGIIEVYGSSGAIAIIFTAFSPKGQRLGDMAAGTTAIRLRSNIKKLGAQLNQRPKLDDDYEPTYSNVLKLSDQDIELCRRAMDAFRETQNREAMEMAKSMVEKKIGVSTDLHPIKFLVTVERDHLYYSLRAEEKRNGNITKILDQEQSL